MTRSGMSTLLLVAAATGALTAPGAAFAAAPRVERVAVSHFTALRVYGPAEIALTQGRGESMAVERPDQRGARIQIEEEAGRLTIKNLGAAHWWDKFLGRAVTPRITLDVEDLRSVELFGSVRVRVDGLHTPTLLVRASGQATLALSGLDADTLTIDSSGAVRADVSGRVHRQTIAISGAGNYRAADLRSDDARVDVSGAGRVTIQARDTLDVRISGAGKVEYLGDPKLTKSVSGAARIEHRESPATRS